MGVPKRVAQTLRPLRRRPLRHHLLHRVHGRTGRVRLPPIAAVRRAAVRHVRCQGARGAEFRPVRAGVHFAEAHDGRVQEVRHGSRRVHYVEFVSFSAVWCVVGGFSLTRDGCV